MADWSRWTLRSDGAGPGPRAELARDASRGFGDGGDEPLGNGARDQPLGVADDADRADGVPEVVEDRPRNAGLAEHGLVALARDAAFADRGELRAQLALAERPPGELRQRLGGEVVDRGGREGQDRLAQGAGVHGQLGADLEDLQRGVGAEDVVDND